MQRVNKDIIAFSYWKKKKKSFLTFVFSNPKINTLNEQSISSS